jgi:predicted AlkP superfamily pyrophosphatase or phosphodiesterase
MVKRSNLSIRLAGGSFALALAGSACGGHYVRSLPSTLDHALRPASSVTRNVILVSVDGLRPDAIAAFDAPVMQRLVREGSATLKASTITPSKTLPSHTSMLTGEPPELHQVLWNTAASAERDEIELPNVFSVARSHGYSTAAFFSKSKFHPLQRPGTLDYSQAPGGWFGRWPSRRTIADVEGYLQGAAPNLLFIHLTDADAAGHESGWMTPEYGRAVSRVDAAIAQLLRVADKAYGPTAYTLIITADHGGHGKDHGSDDARDVTIPWIAWGRGIKPGEVSAAVRTMDTASTVLWLLGVREPTDWAGQPVIDAFEPAPAGVPAAQ